MAISEDMSLIVVLLANNVVYNIMLYMLYIYVVYIYMYILSYNYTLNNIGYPQLGESFTESPGHPT